MWLKLMLFVLVIIAKTVIANLFQFNMANDCLEPVGELFETASIVSFADSNRYIRLNISWNTPLANFTDFKMNVLTNCSSLYIDTVSTDQRYLIEPPTQHPAEPPAPGCKYDIDLFTENYENKSCYKQVLSYQIPECVDTVCNCNSTISPYILKSVTALKDNNYRVQFEKTERIVNIDLENTFAGVQVINKNAHHFIRAEYIQFLNKENAFIVPILFTQKGESYTVKVDLQLDNCWYFFQKELSDDEKLGFPQNKMIYIALFTVLIITLLIVYTIFMEKMSLIKQLKDLLPFFSPTPSPSILDQDQPIKSNIHELLNAQYTPLEFIQNKDKYDKYEIPRNKIVFKNEIGGGAFGKVYRAEVYELCGRPGYTVVAAKKPIEDGPPSELCDFLLEIETMKKIANAGGHRNIIQFLACVTLNSPYVMIMELASCGSLKDYLASLRKEWDKKRNKRPQHFFPDNMDIESYLLSNKVHTQIEPTEKLIKYTDLKFDDNDDDVSSGTDSYITPDTPQSLPSSPRTPNALPARPHFRRKPSTLPQVGKMRSPQSSVSSPLTSESTSNGLPSGTETIITFLESPVTPLINLKKEENGQIQPILDSEELHNFSLQIASGMKYLESLSITHRDLAARNILMNENKILKLSDFGMARAGIYVSKANKRHPLRWMAPEAIETLHYNNKTDVWSFGVVLWEIGSLGAFPYKELGNEEVIHYLRKGKRLQRPGTCTDQVYNLMQKCWRQNPVHRPSFADIFKELDSSKGRIYVDFSKLPPKYVFPPIQESDD